jgi:hypothetical protein
MRFLSDGWLKPKQAHPQNFKVLAFCVQLYNNIPKTNYSTNTRADSHHVVVKARMVFGAFAWN